MMSLLSVTNVARSYGKHPVLRRVTFTAPSGEAAGVIGPNGAGKTTLLRIVVGLLRADSGIVCLDGSDVRGALSRIRVGYFAGESAVPPSVRTRTWRALFHPVEARAENRPARQLSKGTRQLLGLRTLFALPALQLIVLDEPWDGLDPDASRWLTEAIRARCRAGTAVLVASHRLHDLAGVCDRFVFIDHGVASSSSARELMRNGRLTGDSLLEAFDDVRGGPH
jgi:ABC-type multidrug transport system ATPase subunit